MERVTDAALNAVTRNSGASWFIPSEDEWYKAAYYDGSTYHDYATGTDTDAGQQSSLVGQRQLGQLLRCSGYTTGDVNYPLTDAGAYTLSASPYGTFDQGGNVLEWNEFLNTGQNYSLYRGVRGGSWYNDSLRLSSSSHSLSNPPYGYNKVGFRVATVPEPGTLLLGVLGMIETIVAEAAQVALCDSRPLPLVRDLFPEIVRISAAGRQAAANHLREVVRFAAVATGTKWVIQENHVPALDLHDFGES